MAPTFPTTFEKDQSPIRSPASGSNTPISYRANVNRNKTKKWADAKPVDYGGDDYGDDDEYDLPPPPVSKPTGLRQQGQGLQSGPPSASIPVDNKKNYGELPPLPGAAEPSSSRLRTNSFDADDEKRNFSNSTVRQPSLPAEATPAPATRFSQITGVPTTRDPSGPPSLHITTQQLAQQDGPTGLRKAGRGVSPISGSPHPDILLPGPARTNTGDSGSAVSGPSRINTGESGSVYSQPSDIRTPSSDYQARRDFSPTAVPAPLSTTRASPVPVSAMDTASTRFLARKSSLSQSTGPEVSPMTAAQESAGSKPWVTGRSASPASSARSPVSPSSGKALPFIRPADIYRRVEEEKERERQSMDSSRPSMDSVVGTKTSDRSDSPAKPALREKTSSDSLGGGRQRVSIERDDASASGRHLQPMLEPVKERKSEYGFEGFTMNDQAAGPAEIAEQTQPPSEPTQLDIEEARRSSVSPKLPDLNRMSGFGIDFSQPKPEEPEPPLPLPRDAEPTPAVSNITSAPSEDIPDRQPSLGYRSVVNQAFDRKDDSSVPPTPASQTGSGVRRSDSESTGTTGISPIMSRAPSGAVSDVRGREGANPSILEVVHEPSSPVSKEEMPAESQTADHTMGSGIKPGHRRDIRTPSPGNSPARTPKTETIAQSHKAVLADPSMPDTSMPVDDEPLQPPRPITEREGSFRPILPGGWTSYATTARSELPQQDTTELSQEVERTQTPTSPISSAHEQRHDDNYDITPTTTKHLLPQSATSAAAGAALGGMVGPAFGRHDKESPMESPGKEDSVAIRGNSALPTPDPAMAPSGNVYSSTPLDPRLMPKLESVSPEAQLRPAPVQTETSTDSNDAPTPPTKDTPVLGNAEYFPKPTVPLKQRTINEVEADESLAPPMRPQVLPTLSTDTRLQDEESDKLRKEIIKSLSPKPSDAPSRNESLQPEQLEDQTTYSDGRYSYLPREYDNYWATASEDAELASSNAQKATEEAMQVEVPAPSEAPVTSEGLSDVLESPTDAEPPPIPPLSARRTSMATESRPSIPHRFSWETSTEDVSPSQSREAAPEVPAIPMRQEPYQQQAAEGPMKVMDEGLATGPSSHAADAPYSQSNSHAADIPYSQPATLDYDKELGAQGLRSPISEASDDDHDHAGRDAALLAGGAALGGAATAASVHSYSIQTPQQSQQPQRRLSLAEEKDARVSSYPVSPTPPEEEHPSRSPQAYFSGPSTEQPAASAAPSSVSPINSPIKTQFSPTSRILAFKEIAAIKNPHQRIQTYDETRQRFAAIDSGLIDWMANLRAQHPEHATATASFSGAAFPVPNGSARSKYSKATGQSLPPLQQPYYQQYLNASPTTPGTPVSRPGPSIPSGPSGSQQGFSPAGGKSTGQQVQAKGKELLHSAGIFGGKAGKAGKGLLAKGKNKLRGSGAGDKTSPNLSPPPKPRNERRTSWGFPLAVARSSGRPDASARQSKESIPMPTPTTEHQRAGTMNSQRSLPALDIPTSPNYDSPGLMSGTVISPVSQLAPSNEPTLSRGFEERAAENNESEDRDTLGIPAPITKNQPSWDPFNATPIAEEEGFQYDDRPKQQPQALHSAAPPKALVIPEDVGSKSERSNSGDAHFYDAPEEPSDLNDWVMVSPEPEAKEEQPKAEPAPKPESEVYQAPEGPPPNWLKRQQTQPVPEPETTKAPERPHPIVPQPVQSIAESAPRPDSEIYQPPEGPPPSFLKRQQAQPGAEPKIANAPEQPSTSVLNQVQVQPKLAPKLPEEQQPTSVLNRPRFSYEAPVQSQVPAPTYQPQNTASPSSPTQQKFVHSAREQQQQPEQAEEPSRNGSFKGLPPIRRTSTFGLGFGPRKTKQRFPIDDEEELSSPKSQREAISKNYEAEIGAAAGAATVAAYANHDEQKNQPHQVHHMTASTNLAQQRKDSIELSMTNRPELIEAHSSDNSETTVKLQPEPQPGFQAPQAADVRPEGFRRSQDAWRPNAVSTSIQTSPVTYRGSAMGPPQRPSMEQQHSMERQRTHGFSGSNQSTTRPDFQYNNQVPRPMMNQPLRPALYDQPPSSAQRYPELFQTQSQPPINLGQDGELPPHLYQAPLPREAAFLPRQQTSEYQLPGVGPPVDEPRTGHQRRNSGSFLKDLGGRISRGTSRERGNSISRDEGMSPGGRPLDSRGEYPESSIASEEAQEQQKRRSSFFGHLNRASTTGLGPPQSRESVVAHFPGSRTDLLATPQQSPVGPNDRKRSLFGPGSPSSTKSKPNKLSRSSTSGMSDEPGKKKRFSGLSSMFSRSGNPSSRGSLQDRPQATRELSYNERQPIESPQFDQRQTVRRSPPAQAQNQNARGPSQQRQILTRLTTGGDHTKPRQESKTRRPSASNLLSGIMGRKPDQKDRGKDDSSSQGTKSQTSQAQYGPQQIPLGQTYTDLQEQSPQAPPNYPPSHTQQPQPKKYQERSTQSQTQPQERGRRASREPPRQVSQQVPREPQYDRVPIPGGYSLVRGDGAMTVPTEYDPRGLARFTQGQQIDPRYMQQQQPHGIYPQGQPPLQGGPQRPSHEQQASPQPQTVDRHTSQATKPPALSAVESYESYTKRSSPRLSREDLLARSPAREQPGQQRPYQLSLPEDEEDRDHHPNPASKSPPIISAPSSTRSPPTQNNAQQPVKKQHDAIQRLQQPVLRHPESPAGYPLPDDAVFSPVNEAARDVPPPPPPKWPSHQDAQHGHNPNQHLSSQHLNLESELDRSNTRRTAVSAVSGLSGPHTPGLHVPRKGDEGGRDGITPSPTPPSPAYTPERADSPPRYSVDEKELERGLESGHQDRGRTLGSDQNIQTQVNRGPSPDLYNASPRLPPSHSGFQAPPNSNQLNSHLGTGNSNGNGHSTSSSNLTTRPAQPVQSSSSGLIGEINDETMLAKAKSKRLAELENNERDKARMRRERNAQEEKIYYDAETGQEGHRAEEEDGEGVAMSATSYPGQEWNPYGAGGWEEGFD